MNDIEGYIKLIEEFNQFPHEKREITFMEICKYPYSRFEEVCSRILQFFFNPTAEHKLQNLLLNSLLEVIQQTEIQFDSRSIKIGVEEGAEQKRIDMIIEAPNLAICIENKIMSLVNNPLEKYKQECLHRYKDKQLIFLVLTVRRITNPSELRHINDCGFKVVTYSDFFFVVKQNMGNYITACNQKYLTYLLDFIKTIENMTHRIEASPENDFFFDNKKEIARLLSRYQEYLNNILSVQKEQIGILKDKVSESTKSEWWAWQDWDLGISFNDKGNRIGIESSYQATKNNPLGEFKIYITFWRKKDWYPYREKLIELYKDRYLDDNADGRVYLHVDKIEDNNIDLIIEKLSEYYQVVKKLAKEDLNSNKLT